MVLTAVAVTLCCRCFSGSFGPEASDTYHLYLWSGDDLPTHNSVEPRCADRAGAGNGPSTCGAVEVSCAQPPVAEGDGQTAVGTINWQEEPFYLVTINQTLTDPANNGGGLPPDFPRSYRERPPNPQCRIPISLEPPSIHGVAFVLTCEHV